MAKRRDWVLRILMTSSFLVLFLTLALGASIAAEDVLHSIAHQFSRPHSFLDQSATQIATLSERLGLPGEQTRFGLPGFLLLLAVALFVVARVHAVRNQYLWPVAGCPQCQSDLLVRVHRLHRDRVLALSTLPMGRYRCLDCGWKGRRIRRGPVHIANMIGPRLTAQESDDPSNMGVVSARPSENSAQDSPGDSDAPLSNALAAGKKARPFDPLTSGGLAPVNRPAQAHTNETAPALEETHDKGSPQRP